MTPLVSATRAPRAQDPAGLTNPPLMTAQNALSNVFPDVVPEMQAGYANPADIWLLYAPEFDYLSGAMQSYLMRKYGLIGEGGLPVRLVGQTQRAVSREAGEPAQAAAANFGVFGGPNGFVPSDNVRVNDPDLDLQQRVQSETTSAISGSNIVVAYNDNSTGVGSAISFSSNGGLTWTTTAPPIYPFGGAGGDPVLAAGPGGVFYYAHLAFTGLGLSTIGVTRSTDGGATWSPLVNATASTTHRLVSQDKEWMMVDNSNSRFRGNVYLSWTRFTSILGESSGIAFVRSTDGGRTWSQFRLIGRPNDAAGFVQGSTIAVGPDGEVYVSYFDTRIPGIAVVKSTDGGVTFGPPVTALRDPFSRFGKNLAGGFENFPGASIDVDRSNGPNRGAVYVATTIKPAGSRDEADVVVTTSTNGGASWSAPVRANDDSTDTDQFMPSLAVTPAGMLGVMWYDRRNDPTNNVLVDVYMTTSVDGGRTFTPNRRIAAGNWPFVPTPFGFRTAYHGDYNQMSAGDLGFVINWADDRSGTDPDVYANLVSPLDAQKPRTDFIISADTPAQSVFAGASADFPIDINPLSPAYTIGPRDTTGFLRRAKMDAVPRYPGLDYSFSLSSRSGLFHVTAAPSIAPGTYPITVTVSVRGLVRTTTVRLTVYDPNALSQTPRALTGLRDTVFQPKAVVDTQGDLHMVSGAEARRFFSSFGALNYARFRGGVQVASTPITSLTNPNSTILNHAIGVDDAGNPTVVWRLFNADTGRSDIFMSRSTNGGQTFSAPVNLTRNDGRFVFTSPVLAVSRTGVINVAFVQTNPIQNTQEVIFIRSTDGGATFSPRLSASGLLPLIGAPALAPAMAIEGSGAVALVYIGTAPTTRADIFFSRSATGLGFSPPINISNTLTTSTAIATVATPTIAIDQAGNINVAFVRADLNRNEQDIYFTRSTNQGQTFSASINASRTTAAGILSFVPSIGTDSAGNIAIAWGAFTQGALFPGGRDLLFTRSTDGGRTFAPAINLSNNIGQQVFFPQIFVNESGRFTVLWEDETGGNNQALVITP
jgi:hypothetical protein